jgi:hypothetical protein
VQEYLHTTTKELGSMARKHGAAKLAAVAALIKCRNFMARLNADARQVPAPPARMMLPDPQGRLPGQVKEKDIQVCSPWLFRCHGQF